MLCGAVEGMQRVGWLDVPVLAMETEGAESFAAARAAGKAVRLPAITSIASSLGARQVCDQALTWADQHPVISEVVSDAAALIACERLLQDHRIFKTVAKRRHRMRAALAAVTESSKHLHNSASIDFGHRMWWRDHDGCANCDRENEK